MHRIPMRLVRGITTVPIAVVGFLAATAFAPSPASALATPAVQERELVAQFDQNGDERLDRAERDAARAWLAANPPEGRGGRGGRRGGGRGRGGGGGRGGDVVTGSPGRSLTPADVTAVPDAPLYDPETVRTLFLEFEGDDWEAELEAFYDTDVEVPATVTIDGVAYPGVGVHFRGASSYFTVGTGLKRSLNLSFDFVDEDQRVIGYKTLNLLNSHTDASYLRSVLYSQVTRSYFPAPKANYVMVAINGESWGIYVSSQQFDRIFAEENYDEDDGARWKVPGSPNGRGGLEYLGDDRSEYEAIYDIRSNDNDETWAAFIELTRVLNQTPPEQLEEALAPMLDIDGALRFLAIENVMINGDGYWTRASDYNIYQDEGGRFHIIPHDTNETFRAARGGRGGGAGGVTLDPLTRVDDPARPLISKLLAAPQLRARYLGFVREIAETWLDWSVLGPIAEGHQALIRAEVERDTRKLESFEDFESSLDELKEFADGRREFLLNHPAIRGGGRPR